ncbi:cytochrome P450 [Nonomuraea sp. NPDC046802]|uniref:cytochrome P450 n=1 Tax=Nonomuraea sp. NPDC046802 TaxID=3154919 RepID=UPI003408B233
MISVNEAIAVHLPAVNRGPARFTDPDLLSLADADARRHLTFGHGVHQCLDRQLARMEMRIAYPALLRRFPTLKLAELPEQVPMRTDRAVYGVDRLLVEW